MILLQTKGASDLTGISIIGIRGIPTIKADDKLGMIIVDAAQEQRTEIANGDIIVISQKIVSKAEGRLVDLKRAKPSGFAISVARAIGRDPRLVETILSETRRIVKMQAGHLIVETHHGLVCANAGVDMSNVKGGTVALLPKDPDRSARRIQKDIARLTGRRIAVIITDTFGRPWRIGQVNFAIGVAGMKPYIDYRGRKDMFGYGLRVTLIAIADELASAAELVMNKADRVPVAIVRGYAPPRGRGSGRTLIRPAAEDLFR